MKSFPISFGQFKRESFKKYTEEWQYLQITMQCGMPNQKSYDSDDSNDEQYLMQLFWPGLSEVQFIDTEQEKQK